MSRTATVTTTVASGGPPAVTIRRTLTVSNGPTVSPPSSPSPPTFSLPLLLAFPVRVALVTAIALLYLLNVHSASSLLSFALSFVFFTLTSAPATGHPNAIEHVLQLLLPASTRPATTQRHRPTRSISLRFTVRDYHCHVHHWLYCLAGYAVSCALFVVFVPPMLSPRSGSGIGSGGSERWWYDVWAGWCLGGVCQGLKYDDWCHVLWRREIEQQQHQPLVQADGVELTTAVAME